MKHSIILAALFLVVPLCHAQEQPVVMARPVTKVVLNGKSHLQLVPTNTPSVLTSPDPKVLHYTYTPQKHGELTIDSGEARLFVPATAAIAVTLNGQSRLEMLPGQ